MIELEALNTLAANDPGQEKHCVQLLEWFDYRWAGWQCSEQATWVWLGRAGRLSVQRCALQCGL